MADGLTRVQALRRLTELAGGRTECRRRVRADHRLRHLARRQPDRLHHRTHGVSARLADVREPAGGQAGNAGTLRRRPGRRHAHARDPRLRRRTQQSEPASALAEARRKPAHRRSRPTATRSPSPRPPPTSSTATATSQQRVRRLARTLRSRTCAAGHLAAAAQPEHRTRVAAQRERPLTPRRQRAAGSRGAGRGSLCASAQSSVRVKVVPLARRTARRAPLAARQAGDDDASRADAWRAAAKRARGEGLVTLALTLRAAAIARSRPGAAGCPRPSASSFTAPGHRALRESVPVTFLRSQPKRRPAKRPAKRRAGKARRRR